MRTTTKRRIIEFDRQRPSDLSAIAFGVPKSGTAFLTSVLTVALGSGVYKTHRYVDVQDDIPVYIIVRDFRDCLVSLFRSHYPDERHMTRADVFDKSHSIMPSIWSLRQYVKHIPSCRLIRYEDCVFDIERFSASSQIPVSDLAPAFNTYSFENSKRYVESLTNHTPDGIWAVRHMRDGEIGQWSRFIPDSLHPLVNDLFMSPLRDFQYV